MFSEALRSLRIKAGWTQQELADKVDMSKSSISMLESGARSPSYEALEAFADVFNVDMNTLTGGKIPELWQASLDVAAAQQFKKIKPAIDKIGGLSDEDVELVNLLLKLSPDQAQRVRDFVAGILSSR